MRSHKKKQAWFISRWVFSFPLLKQSVSRGASQISTHRVPGLTCTEPNGAKSPAWRPKAAERRSSEISGSSDWFWGAGNAKGTSHMPLCEKLAGARQAHQIPMSIGNTMTAAHFTKRHLEENTESLGIQGSFPDAFM